MTAEQWAIYWWSIAESIQTYLIIGGFVAATIVPVVGAVLCSESDTAKAGVITIISGLVVGILSLMLDRKSVV